MALGGLDTERRIAARAASAWNQILPLRLLGQREEGLGLVLGLGDQFIGNAVVRDDSEAIFLKAPAELMGESFWVAGCIVQVNGRYIVSGYRSHVFVLAEDCGQGSTS